MDNDPDLREQMLETLVRKANLKQKVHENTLAVFDELKEILHEMTSEMNDELDDVLDKRVRIEYRDRGKFEAQLQVAGDMLVFNMHTNVFRFDSKHEIWQNPYVKDDKFNAYCGIINIYNFLADSLKYNRGGDEGYLIGRIFINREMKYFVEGKKQVAVRHGEFGRAVIDKAAILKIVEHAAAYAMSFDLLVPPYDKEKQIMVDQLSTKIENAKLQTGKRLGYEFTCDDV